jgi:hypothetical protein
MDSGYPLLPLGIYTPPKFIRMIKSRNFDRESLGGWQLGGASFVAIGDAWNISQEFITENSLNGYRLLRKASDELRDRIDSLVMNATVLAEKFGYPPSLPSGS